MIALRSALGALALCGICLLPPACSSSSSREGGSGGSAGSSGSGGSGGLPSTYGDTACVQCIMQQCSDDSSRCSGNSECSTALACILACPPKNSHEADETCTDACAEPTSPDGAAAYSAFWDCFDPALDGPCATPCD
jgi:hypothetical protein